MGIHYNENYKSQTTDYCGEVDLMDQLKFHTNRARRLKIIVHLKKVPLIGSIHITPEDIFEDVKKRYEEKVSSLT